MCLAQLISNSSWLRVHYENKALGLISIQVNTKETMHVDTQNIGAPWGSANGSTSPQGTPGPHLNPGFLKVNTRQALLNCLEDLVIEDKAWNVHRPEKKG